MKISYIPEPSLQFGNGQHISIKRGLYELSPYDLNTIRPDKITIGIVGSKTSIDLIITWIEDCKSHIQGKESKKDRPNLFMNFPGFNKDIGFHSEIVYDDSYLRPVRNSDVKDIIKNSKTEGDVVENLANLYLDEIKFLSQNKNPDVIICVLEEKLAVDFLLTQNIDSDLLEDTDTENETVKVEDNFRRLLKAKAMTYHVPIQLVRDRVAKPTAGMQDPATIAWNFFTALYYKASGIPWALVRKDSSFTTCFAGISFYQSRDFKTLQTSVAQIFNEQGSGIILRGGEVQIDKKNRTPHLSVEQSYNLMTNSLREFYIANKIYPKRLVIHKTSNFSDEEIEGFVAAAENVNINEVDLITVMITSFRLFRRGQYPPLRGTHLAIDDKNHILYTRGAVPYYETYTGMYIPSPIQLRVFKNDESVNTICKEIIGLTKMNWNNTQFDRKQPVTIECARTVGEVLKYVPKDKNIELKYSFYM